MGTPEAAPAPEPTPPAFPSFAYEQPPPPVEPEQPFEQELPVEPEQPFEPEQPVEPEPFDQDVAPAVDTESRTPLSDDELMRSLSEAAEAGSTLAGHRAAGAGTPLARAGRHCRAAVLHSGADCR